MGINLGFGSNKSTTTTQSSGTYQNQGNQSTQRYLPEEFQRPIQDWQNATVHATNPYIQGQGEYTPEYQRRSMAHIEAHATNPASLEHIDSSIANQVGMQQQGPNLLGKMTSAATAQAAAPDNISAQNISSRMGDYNNPYHSQVVDSTLKNFDATTSRDFAGKKWGMGRNAFGSNGQNALALYGAEADMKRGMLEGGLRSQGWDKAAELGTRDVNNALTASQSNQQAQMATSLANMQAANTMNQFNSNMQNNRDQFNVNSMNTNFDQRLNAGNSAVNNVLGRNQMVTGNLGLMNNASQRPVDNMFTATGMRGQPLQTVLPLVGGQDTETSESGSQEGTTVSKGKTSGFKFGIG
jgi:hypothetical protein